MTSDKTKVAFISPWNRKGGLATYSHYLVPTLQDSCDIQLIPWDSEPIYIRGSGIPLVNLSLLSSIRKSDIAHVQYTFGRYMLSFPLLLLICTLFRTPIIITQHERFDNLPFPRIVHVYHQLLYFFVDRIVVHTEYRKRMIWEHHQPRIVVIEHGIIPRDSINRKPRDIKTVLFPGGIRPIKGHDIAIRALADLDGITLRIVGGIGDEQYYQKLRNEANRYNVDEQIEWVTDFIPEEDLFLEFQNADAVLLPYETHTSMSGILSHCISWRVPTLVTDCPAFRHMISCEEAFLTERTGKAIARGLRNLNTNRERQKAIIQEFETVSEEYSWENISSRLTELYQLLDGI